MEQETSHYSVAGLLIRGLLALLMIVELIGAYFLAIFEGYPAEPPQLGSVEPALIGGAVFLTVVSAVLNRKLKNPTLKSFLSVLDLGVVVSGFLLAYLKHVPHLVIPFFVVGMVNTIIGMRRDCMA